MGTRGTTMEGRGGEGDVFTRGVDVALVALSCLARERARAWEGGPAGQDRASTIPGGGVVMADLSLRLETGAGTG